MADYVKIKDECVAWIKQYFENNGKDCNAIVGISGGKDSSVVAALCVEALGRDKVLGVLMPQGVQSDISASYELVKHLGIRYVEINIGEAVQAVLSGLRGYITPSRQTKVNLPARIRMATLFAVSQSMNGRVANTCNLSEDWVGYSTLFGDSVGQFAPLSNLTCGEVCEIGIVLGLPHHLVYKTPSDGLSGKTDEENFGFTYHDLDKYIRTGTYCDLKTKEKIDNLHKANAFKMQPMPAFNPGLLVYADE